MGGNGVPIHDLTTRSEEGFVLQHSTVLDDLGLPETHVRNPRDKGKGRTKPPKGRKNFQKAKFVFNRSSKSTVEYMNYFNPDPQVEAQLLGFSSLVRESCPSPYRLQP